MEKMTDENGFRFFKPCLNPLSYGNLLEIK